MNHRPLVLLDALFYQDDRNLEDSVLSLVDVLAKKFFLKNPEYMDLEEARKDAIELVAYIMYYCPAPLPAPRGQKEG